jgi:hypothetical protein
MATDVYNVWDCVYGIMCIPCSHREWCHDGIDEDEANDRQMVICIGEGQIKRIDHQIIKKDEIDYPLGAELEEEDPVCQDRDSTGDR